MYMDGPRTGLLNARQTASSLLPVLALAALALLCLVYLRQSIMSHRYYVVTRPVDGDAIKNPFGCLQRCKLALCSFCTDID